MFKKSVRITSLFPPPQQMQEMIQNVMDLITASHSPLSPKKGLTLSQRPGLQASSHPKPSASQSCPESPLSPTRGPHHPGTHPSLPQTTSTPSLGIQILLQNPCFSHRPTAARTACGTELS